MIYVNDETSKLKKVVLGIGKSFKEYENVGAIYDAKSHWSYNNNIYPSESSVKKEIKKFQKTLNGLGVEVLKPKNIPYTNQIFCRDIGFVIEDIFFIANVTPEKREEQNKFLKTEWLSEIMNDKNMEKLPPYLKVEGGDIILYKDIIFVGFSEGFEDFKTARTNKQTVMFLKERFPQKKVFGFSLKKSDINPYEGVLHLDCCFQPVGKHLALIHEEGFIYKKDLEKIYEIFGPENLIEVNKDEAFHLATNVISVSPDTVISEVQNTETNKKLKEKGLKVIKVPYRKVSLLGGSLRCSTLPILREK